MLAAAYFYYNGTQSMVGCLKMYIKNLSFVCSAFLGQNSSLRYTAKVPIKLLWASLLIFCMIMVSSWSANIICMLTAQEEQVSFRDLQDLLDQNEYTFGTRYDTLAGLYF